MVDSNPVAVITGGCAGLGWVIGNRFREAGHRVIAIDRSPGFTASGGDAARDAQRVWIEADVTDEARVKQVFDEIASTHGRIDVLVNNAGIQRHGPLEHLPAADWSDVISVNLTGVFLCLQQAGLHMLDAGHGSIVNIASVATRGAAGRAPYAAAKAAVVALTATAAGEWASRGVRVNAVAPGYIDAGMLRAGVSDQHLDAAEVLRRIPAGRLADANEVADVVHFLTTRQAEYIHGQTIYVDGGFMVDYGVPLSTMPIGRRS